MGRWRARTVIGALAILSAVATPLAGDTLLAALAKYVPDVEWRVNSAVTADFTCQGHQQTAVLGTNSTSIVIAVFLNGTGNPPEVLRYLARMRHAVTAVLKTESLDYKPMEEVGHDLPGFRRSKICKGMLLNDGETDPAHIYWNHDIDRFSDFSH